MATPETQTERRLQVKVQQREEVHANLEDVHRELDGGEPNDSQKQLIVRYRKEMEDLDVEIDQLDEQVQADREAAKRSDAIRKRARAAAGVADVDENGEVVYRSLGQVAIDQILTSNNRHARAHVGAQGVAQEEIQRAKHRLESLERTPATTLTSDIAGLSAPQFISEIFQVANTDRPIVDAARKVNLTKLTWTYPQVDASPVVAAQGTQKTEAGNTGLDVTMVTQNATTYLGGGNLSWQAISFSDPSAYDLWFQRIAADYALKTETDAATVVSASAFLNAITTTLTDITDYAEVMTAIAAGGSEVYANSGRMANAVIMAPDAYWQAIGLVSDSMLAFGSSGLLNVSGTERPLRIIVSRGLNAGEIIVGDMAGLLVAENADAPVRMFVSEPAIAGVEVGLVGLFDAAVADDGAFALVTTAS